jgi:hypothetical protein
MPQQQNITISGWNLCLLRKEEVGSLCTGSYTPRLTALLVKIIGSHRNITLTSYSDSSQCQKVVRKQQQEVFVIHVIHNHVFLHSSTQLEVPVGVGKIVRFYVFLT